MGRLAPCVNSPCVSPIWYYLRKIGLDEHVVAGLFDDLEASGVTILSHTTASGFVAPPTAWAGPTAAGKGGTRPASPVVVQLRGAEGHPPPPSSIEADVYMAAPGPPKTETWEHR